MADLKLFKQKEIPFILDGQTIVKTVNKNTTCSDVINKLPNLSCPLAVFESVNGVERELSGKVKLLKVWRAQCPKKNVVFVIKKTSVINKGRKIASKLFSDRRTCENRIAESQNRGLSKDTLKQVSDYAFFARSQKTEVDVRNKKLKGEPLISKLEKRKIQYSLTSLKLVLKEKYQTKSKVTRTTSTGTISSTDTGYQSSGSEYMSGSETENARFRTDFCSSIPERHTSIFSDLSGLRHSTPIIACRSQKRRADDTDQTFLEDCSVTNENLKYHDECQGKNIILQRFMNDQIISANSFIGSDVATTSLIKRQHRDRSSMPIFSNQEEKCRFLWDQYCDSDSDSDSEASEPCESLDIAFHAKTSNQDTSSRAGPRILGRESTIPNLNRFSQVSSDIGLDMSDDGSSFNNSFDCSFSRMDESRFSLDLSYSFDDSESEADYSDHSVDSFMKTRSFQDSTDNVTTLV